MDHTEITSSVKVLATRGGIAIDDDSEVYEYEDDQVKVLHRGEAVTLWRRGEQDPILVVSSRGKCMHIDENAQVSFDHVHEAAKRLGSG